MVSIAEKVGDIIAPIARDLAEFEKKVLELERKCAEFRSGVQGLSQDLRDACARFSPPEVAAEGGASLSEADAAALAVESAAEGIPALRLAELAGVSSRVELKRGKGPQSSCVMIVRQPGGGVIPVDCSLSHDICARTLGELKPGDARQEPDELLAEIRRIIADISSPACREGFGKPVERVVLYVPFEMPREALLERLPGISEEAAAARVFLAPPSALLGVLRSVAGAWLRFACSGSVRSLVDKGQDLVDDLSAFISFFTENEKALCEAVESYARASRAPNPAGGPPA